MKDITSAELLFLDAYNKAGEQTKEWINAILKSDLKQTRKQKQILDAQAMHKRCTNI